MIPAIFIASRFIQLGIEQDKYVTPMKLQKLVYLAHGIHLAKFDEPLISEDVEAWSYGPVIRSVYDMFKSWGNKPIDEIPEIEIKDLRYSSSYLGVLTSGEEQSVQLAWAIAKDMSGEQLSNWSHSNDSPWHRTYTGIGKKKIRRDIIRDYFIETMEIEHE